MADSELATDEQLDELHARLLSNEDHRVVVVGADTGVVRAWAKHRDIALNRCVHAFERQHLIGITAESNTTVVVLRGAGQMSRWNKVREQLRVLAAHEVPILNDALPADIDPTPLIGGCWIGGFRGEVNLRQREKGQGDEFRLQQGGTIVTINRQQVDDVIEFLVAFRDGEPMPDPIADRAAAIRQAVEATGDPYARPE